MCIIESKKIDAKIKEYEQLMNTYRYLGDMNVKYFMFYLIVVGFILKAFVDSKEFTFWLIGFLGLIGLYSYYSIRLVLKRMGGVEARLSVVSGELEIGESDFSPFITFLKATKYFVLIFTITVSIGMIKSSL